MEAGFVVGAEGSELSQWQRASEVAVSIPVPVHNIPSLTDLSGPCHLDSRHRAGARTSVGRHIYSHRRILIAAVAVAVAVAAAVSDAYASKNKDA